MCFEFLGGGGGDDIGEPEFVLEIVDSFIDIVAICGASSVTGNLKKSPIMIFLMHCSFLIDVTIPLTHVSYPF